LHIVGCLYYLYQWYTVKQISDNEIYLLIKYIKSFSGEYRNACPYIQDARCLKIKPLERAFKEFKSPVLNVLTLTIRPHLLLRSTRKWNYTTTPTRQHSATLNLNLQITKLSKSIQDAVLSHTSCALVSCDKWR